MGRPTPSSPEGTAEPTPEPTSVVTVSGGHSGEEDEWEVVGADDVGAKGDPFPPSEPEIDRERLLAEAGRLYGRDTARERAALLDGSHPICRLQPAAK